MSLLATPTNSSNNASTSSALGIGSGSGAASGSVSAAGNGSAANNNLPFEKDKIWYFSNEQLGNSPSRRCGIKADDELHYRQMTAYLIQEMGQRLQVSQLCINTAIVYMHRFYAFHSFTHFHRNSMASASLFLAAKVEEQPRKLEHVIRAANKCLPQTTEQNYADLAQELVFNENVLLQTLGFDVAIDHPHTHVVRTCQLVKACKDLAQTSYFLASNSLHLTSMCLQYRPTVVACFCIYLACKWSRWEIPQSTEGKHWFYYVDKSVSLELLKQLTDEFIAIYEKSPARLKSKLNSIKAIAQGASNRTAANSKDNKPKEDWKMSEMMKGYHSNITAPPELMNGNDSREQSAQQVAALLPPPSMVPQQRRGGGDHSSHQRSSVGGGAGNSSSSSSSSSSSASHNKLPNYAGALPPDAHTDHKSKQPSYNNRVPSSHQSSSSSSSASAQRSSSSGGNGNSMSSSSSASSGQRGSSSSQQSRPSLPMDYHKSSRGLPNAGLGMPPHGAHKMPPNSKQQQQQPLLDSRSSSAASAPASSSSSSVSSKDGVKSSSSSKMYPNAPPPYSNPAGASNSLMRGGYMSASGNGGSSAGGSNGVPGSTSYHAHRSNKSSSSASASASSSSVHNMQPYEQLAATLPYGQAAPNANAQPIAGSYNHLQLQLDAPAPNSQQQQIKNNSLFSPEWSEMKKEPATHYNGLLPPPPPDSLGYKLNSHGRDKDSPKKERLTPTKKEKHRSSAGASSLPPPAANSATAGQLKAMLPPSKKLATELPNELAGTSREGSQNSLKRGNETQIGQYGLNMKLEEDSVLPRDKIRKLDSFGYSGGNSHVEDKHAPLSISNGIETTPDLVRSLLKESLCTANASLLKPEALTMPGLKPPAELFEPLPMPTLHIKKESIAGAASGLTASSATANSAMSDLMHAAMDLDVLTKLGDVKEEAGGAMGSSKSEKKKKKDKHKHKEKDKSKDKSEKEERKKHKKEKQKERGKDMAGVSNPAESLKLVIKTNSAAGNPNGLVSMHTTASSDGGGGGGGSGAAPLKLKISKNKVEPSNYSTDAQQTLGSGAGFGASYGAGYGLAHANVGSSSSSSSKKKDRDRERDKEKKSKNQDYAKHNGAGAAPGAAAGGGVTSITASLPLPPGMLLNTLAPNAALPVYTKK